MSLNRLIFLILMTIYLHIDPVPRQGEALAVLGVGLILVIGIFTHIVIYPAPNNSRRVVAACADLFTISFEIHAGGDAGAVFYPLLLWTILGNGFRFGVRWLVISGCIAFVGFAAVIATTPFWQQHVPLCVGLGIALVAIPGYAGALIRKLDSARRQAVVANEAKTMFLATVSHQLRTPLNAIIGAQSALCATALDDGQREMSRLAQQGAQLLLASIDELLDFSQIEAGAVRLNPIEFDLLELLDEVMGLFRPAAAAKSIRLVLHVALDCACSLRGERRFLRDILQNLIGNAVKFTREGGVLVAIGSTPTGAQSCLLTVEVIDTGIGIASEALEHVFDSFRQADKTILDNFGGTGLGLSICRRLATALSGRIEVESVLGKGSRFRFQGPFEQLSQAHDTASAPFRVLDATGHVQARLAVVAAPQHRRMGRSAVPDEILVVAPSCEIPADAAQDRVIRVGETDSLGGADTRWHCLTRLPEEFTEAQWLSAMRLASLVRRRPAPSGAEMIASRPRQRLRVLVADDNLLNQRVLTRMLEQAGHQVAVASDGDGALDLIDSARPDVVLMDVNMPNLNGLDATRLYRAASLDLAHLPIIGLTATATPELRQTCLAAGMDSCLTKPVDQGTLINALDRLASAETSTEPAIGGPMESEYPTCPLDEAKLQRLVALDGADFMREMVMLFSVQAEAAGDDLREAHRLDDLLRFREVAHSLLSSAVNVGADRVAHEAMRLQHVPVEVFGRSAASVLRPILAEISTVQAEIAQRLPP